MGRNTNYNVCCISPCFYNLCMEFGVTLDMSYAAIASKIWNVFRELCK